MRWAVSWSYSSIEMANRTSTHAFGMLPNKASKKLGGALNSVGFTSPVRN